MADYTRYTWTDDVSDVTGSRLNNIEAGLLDASPPVHHDVVSSLPAAAAANKGHVYIKNTDWTIWRSNGSAWTQVTSPMSHAAQHLPGGSDALTTAAAGAIQPDDAAAAGSAASFARSDHVHSIVAAAAGALTDQALEGTATSFARSDHDHSFPNFGTVFHGGPPMNVPASSAFVGANTLWYVAVRVLHRCTLTGISYCVGNTSNGNVRCALYDSGGTRVANRTTNLAQGTASQPQLVAFDGTYVAAPGLYFIALLNSSATGTAIMAISRHELSNAAQGSFTTPGSITPPTTPVNSLIPQMATY